MSLRLIENLPGSRLRGPRVDVWNTISAWLWATYFLGVSAAFGWWVL
jgi:hypothetical protein